MIALDCPVRILIQALEPKGPSTQDLIDTNRSRGPEGLLVRLLDRARSPRSQRKRISGWRCDPTKLDAIARMGGSVCATTRDRFEMPSPKLDEWIARKAV
jgi:hypothetical protein